MSLLRRILRKHKSDERGSVMVELVFIMPFMVLWILGSNAFFDAFKTYLRASRATYTAIDLVSRQDKPINRAYVNNVGAVFRSIVDADGTQATFVMTSIQKDNDALKIIWSVDQNGNKAWASPAQIPDKYVPDLQEQEYIILIETKVPFIPKKLWGNLKAKTFSNTIAVTPRFVPNVTCTNC